MPISPEQIAKTGTESGHQRAFFSVLPRYWHDYPMLKWMHAIPNGGDRNMAVASNMKAEGVRAGVPDVCLPVARGGYHALYVEFKKPTRRREKNGGLSDVQLIFKNALTELGNCVIVVYTWEEALSVTLKYLELPPDARQVEEHRGGILVTP